MAKVVIHEDLVELGLSVATKEEAIKILANRLSAFDCVYDDYYDNIIAREKNYPTGLPSVIPVAVCHTEAKYVKQSAIAVATLTQPLSFREMGSPDRFIQAEIIFLIAISDPNDQVPWLKKMARVFKSKEMLEQIKNSGTKQEIVDLLQQVFADSLAISGSNDQ